jgi:hypothetical protein
MECKRIEVCEIDGEEEKRSGDSMIANPKYAVPMIKGRARSA